MSYGLSSPYQTWRCHINNVPWTTPAAGSPPLLSITWLFSLLFTPSPFLRLIPWLIPRGWRAAATPGPWGWSAILAPAAWPFLVVISFPLITWISFFLVLVPRFYFTVRSGVRSSSGAASSTTIISVVTIVISSTVRCQQKYWKEEGKNFWNHKLTILSWTKFIFMDRLRPGCTFRQLEFFFSSTWFQNRNSKRQKIIDWKTAVTVALEDKTCQQHKMQYSDSFAWTSDFLKASFHMSFFMQLLSRFGAIFLVQGRNFKWPWLQHNIAKTFLRILPIA